MCRFFLFTTISFLVLFCPLGAMLPKSSQGTAKLRICEGHTDPARSSSWTLILLSSACMTFRSSSKLSSLCYVSTPTGGCQQQQRSFSYVSPSANSAVRHGRHQKQEKSFHTDALGETNCKSYPRMQRQCITIGTFPTLLSMMSPNDDNSEHHYIVNHKAINNQLLSVPKNYAKLKVKELKPILRNLGAKVSGTKAELIERLRNIVNQEEQILLGGDKEEKGASSDMLEKVGDAPYNLENWTVLEPSIVITPESNETNGISNDFTGSTIHEFPFLSGLLFVNKPSGMSTLPTREQMIRRLQSENKSDTFRGDSVETRQKIATPGGAQLKYNFPSRESDSLTTPVFPCLADEVKQWLNHHPDGQARLLQAKKEEERWWDFVGLSQKPRSKNRHANLTSLQKQWKKRNRRKKKQYLKDFYFEPRPVHRLDIDTSGIVCIALTPYALRAASILFEKKSRQYLDTFASKDCGQDGNRKELSLEDIHHDEERNYVAKRYVALVEGTLGNDNTDVEKEKKMNKTNNSGIISYSIGKVWLQDDETRHCHGITQRSDYNDTGSSDHSDGDIPTSCGHHEWACDILGNETIAFCRPGDENASFSSSSFHPLTFVPDSLREAMTSYQAVDWEEDENNLAAVFTRVELTPHTGRGHQLRLHMASIGHPIVGDTMHGSLNEEPSARIDSKLLKNEPFTRKKKNEGKLCLHACDLSMNGWYLNPKKNGLIQKCRITVESPPPF